jgi:anti-sigma regulatory factor (Ser/Thr protein kinase)
LVLELRIDSRSAEQLAGLHSWFDVVTHDLPGSMHYGMRLALEEAVMNVAMHAFPPNTGGEISVGLRLSPGAATLCVEDAGSAFDPTAAPAQRRPASLLEAERGGFGLALLRHYCSDITYERIGERNQLTLRFPLPPA